MGRLLAAQFPQWADLPIEPVPSAGTDNALYRLGDDMVVRLPRIDWAVEQVDKEHQWLPRLAPHLPLAIPVPLAKGTPGEGYPWHWSVYRWLDGENATIERIADLRQAATELARFVVALQRIDTTGGPPPGRATPFAACRWRCEHPTRTDRRPARHDRYRRSDRGLGSSPPGTRVARPAGLGPRRPATGNLLFVEGRLSAVIDFGSLGVGDPACDLIVAWNVLSADTGNVFRARYRSTTPPGREVAAGRCPSD